MFCPNCGEKVALTVEFCPNCGKSLKTAGAQQDNILNGSSKHKTDREDGSLNGWIYKQRKFISGAIVIIVLAILGYFLIYVPTSVNAVLKDNGFTAQNGYTIKNNVLSRTITLRANTNRVGHFESAIVGNNYDTSKIDAEEQLGKTANILSGKLVGKWDIKISQATYKETAAVLWEYVGTKEVTRYQTSEECLRARKEYLQKQAEQQENDDNTSAAIGGAVVGGLVGSILSK